MSVTYSDIVNASNNIKDVIVRTPALLLPSSYANTFKTYIKCENLQLGGSFKIRGALNSLLNLTKEQKAKGVITYSSGNHAIAMAIASRLLSIPVTIIMPNDSPKTKVNITLENKAEIIFYDRINGEDREVICTKIQEERGGLTLIPPFNYNDVIAGQGTCALELFEDIGELDYLFVCVGGGGLLAGSVLAAKQLSPSCKVYGVEPEEGNDVQQSLRTGEIIKLASVPKTIADGAQTQAVGKIPFEIIQNCQNVKDILTVSDQQLIDTMKYMANNVKLVVEPTGCLALAGMKYSMDKDIDLSQLKIGIIISGGNVDMDKLATYIV